MPTASIRRREPPDVRRTQILDAAEHVLIERGLTASMADVAGGARVAKGTVYLYFASKADLLAALRARYLERFAAEVDVARARSRPGTAGAIVDFAAMLFDWSVANAALHHVLFHEAGVSEEDAFATGRALMARLVRDGVERGDVHVSDPELVARFLLDAIHGLLVATMHAPAPERARYDAAVAEMVPRVLGTALS